MVNSDFKEKRAKLSSAKQALLKKRLKDALNHTVNAPAIQPRPDISELPLSFAQERLWFLSQLAPDNPANNRPFALRFKGPLEVGILTQTVNDIFSRHDLLRSVFPEREGTPIQRQITDKTLDITVTDLSNMSLEVGLSHLKTVARAAAQETFDLSKGPLIKVRMFSLGATDHVLLVVPHHILFDAWSVQVFIREISLLYKARLSNNEIPLKDLRIQYADAAYWERKRFEQGRMDNALSYWKNKLRDAPPLLALPIDHNRPQVQTFEGKHQSLTIPSALAEALEGICRREEVTHYMVLLAAFYVLLHRYTGQEDILVGTPVAARPLPEMEDLIGFFANTLVLRQNIQDNPSFSVLLHMVKAECTEAFTYQELPFEKMVEALQPARVVSHTPFFQVMFNFETEAPHFSNHLEGLTLETFDFETGTAAFDLTLEIIKNAEGLRCVLEFNTTLFEPATAQRLINHYQILLQGIAKDPSQPISHLPMLTKDERHQLLFEWNQIPKLYPQGKCLHQLFEDQARRQPDQVALVFEEHKMTYGELNQRANQIAHYLQRLGVGQEVLVGLFVERSMEMLVGILAVLKAGGAYLPLDPAYPKERLAFMLEDSHAKFLICHKGLLTKLPAYGGEIIQLDTGETTFEKENKENPEDSANPDNLAYVIYTSGSTGTPKGVMVEHRNVVRLFSATETWFHFDASDVWTLFHSYAFDFSVWEIWGALLYGGRLVVVPKTVTRLPDELYKLLCRQKVTILNQTPSAFQLLMNVQERAQETHSLRVVIFGGEALQPVMLQPWYQHQPTKQTQLVNMYGITETTVHVTYHPLDPVDLNSDGGSPIGCRIPDLRIYILDANRQPVPVGVPGELYIGGEGVARGYLNRPELNVERFLPDPFVEAPGARMYKSGDLGKWRDDGTIEYLGRNDFQVKIRGFRIELGEIEARMIDVDGVGHAVVLVREDRPGDKRLVAYYTIKNIDQELPSEVLRGYLAGRLPEYMVPSAYVVVERMPLTPNGKIDRKKLLSSEASFCATSTYEAPVGEREEILSQIWSELLGVGKVGRHDQFFDLGGYSLLVIKMIGKLRSKGFRVDMGAFFVTPVLKDLACAIQKTGITPETPPNLISQNSERITPEMLSLIDLDQRDIDRIVASTPGGTRNIEDIYPLTPMQEGMLFHKLLNKESDVYLLFFIYSAESRELLDDFLSAVQAVIDRHDILRSAFLWEDLPEPVQVVWRGASLIIDELNIDPARGDVISQLRSRFNRSAFHMDLRLAPLMRAFIAYDNVEKRWLLALLHHHLLTDHTTMEILGDEIRAHLAGEASVLPDALPYRDFVAKTRIHNDVLAHERFFREMLEGVTEPTVPYGLINVQGDGADIDEANLMLEARLSRQIRESSKRLGISAASLFHLAWARVVASLSGSGDVVFGTVLFGRMHGDQSFDRTMGLFINTLPLRINITNGSVEQAAKRVHRILGELIQHEHAPLTLAQRCSELPASTPLFSTLLNYRYDQSEDFIERVNASFCGVQLLYAEERTNYPLVVSVDDSGESFLLTAKAQPPIEPVRICKYMATAIGHLAKALDKAPLTPVGAIDVLPYEERQQVLFDWNATQTNFPKDQCIHQLFEKQVEKTPKGMALVYKDKHLTYDRLNQLANQLAHHLQKNGVGPEVLVGLYMERSFELIIGLLGIFKAGGGYAPLDPSYSKKRLSFMLEDANLKMVLSTSNLSPLRSLHNVQTIHLDELEIDTSDGSRENITCTVTPDNLAYVIYTSGSTGLPKGAMISQQALVNLVCWSKESFPITDKDRVALKTPISFDASVWELFIPLLAGAALIVAEPGTHKDPERLIDWIIENNITILKVVPSQLRMLLSGSNFANCNSLHQVISGGEVLTVEIQEQFLKQMNAALINVYGPTEACVNAAFFQCGDEVIKTQIPIGRPIANTQIYILDEWMQPVPIMATGEIFIGGDGVGKGYLNRQALTTEKFIPDPFGDDPAARLYRTGDLARYQPDGAIEFVGRKDQQVKIRGYRIELGEIEASLESHPEVKVAAVVAWQHETDDIRLVAYIVSAVPNAPDVKKISTYLKQRLPDYMIPTVFIPLPSLPILPNGKTDRRALPKPELTKVFDADSYTAPRSATEQKLLGIWKAILGIENICVLKNFFDLGGHSLLVTRVVSKIRTEFQVNITLREFFGSPTIVDMARAIEEKQIDAKPLQGSLPDDDNLQQKFPLSHAQQRLWFLDQLIPETGVYNIVKAYRYKGDLNIETLELSLSEIVRRHEALRARFGEKDGTPFQTISPHMTLSLPVLDVSETLSQNREEKVQRFIFKEFHNKIDLAQGPLFRFHLIKLKEEYIFILSIHHIVADGWSFDAFLNELSLLYNASINGQRADLPKLPIQYTDYAVSQQDRIKEEEMTRHFLYWEKQLKGLPTLLELPYDRPRPAIQRYKGALQSIYISKSQNEALVTFCRAAKVTPYMVLLSTFQILLFRYSNQEDLAVGSPVANRHHMETMNLIGFFVNTLVMRSDLSGDPTYNAFLSQVRDTALDSYEHQVFPFEKIVEAFQPERDLSHHPLFQVMFAYQNTFKKVPLLSGIAIDLIKIDSGLAKFDLELHLWNVDDGHEGHFCYNTDLFDAETIQRMSDHFLMLLNDIIAHPEKKISELTLLTPFERRQLLEEWNDMQTGSPVLMRCHEMFERQAQATPNRVALQFEKQQLNYESLNRAANHFAVKLQSLGVRPNVPVGICIDRSIEVFIGILGILKAGGSYVPLDPTYPAERLSYMLSDSGADILVTNKKTAHFFPNFLGQILYLDGEKTMTGDGDRHPQPINNNVTADDVAYILYTSGSTGRPKGVAMSHGPLSNLISWQIKEPSFTKGAKTLQFAPLCFDVSFQEMFSTWCTGGTLMIVRDDMRRNAQALLQFLGDKKIHRLFLPFIALQNLTEAATLLNQYPSCLKELITAGEQLHITKAIATFFNKMKDCTLQNQYGPTESHVVSSYMLQGGVRDWPQKPPIGRPIDNARLFVLDKRLQPVPIGVTGELYIGGNVLAKGYVNNQQQTKTKFFSDPFSSGHKAKLYKTGDLARFLSDGNIEFIGRKDNQVKVQGYRIELGEVEGAIGQYTDIKDNAVLAVDAAPGDKRLVGFVVLREGKVLYDRKLRHFLRQYLPDYMIPSIFKILDALPLLPNGKLDRDALPVSMNLNRGNKAVYVAPQTPIEKALVGIWSEVLKLDKIGIHDNFFELGGHSLLVMRVASRVFDEFQIDVPLKTFFEMPTVAGLVQMVTDSQLETILTEEALDIVDALDGISEEEAQRILDKRTKDSDS